MVSEFDLDDLKNETIGKVVLNLYQGLFMNRCKTATFQKKNLVQETYTILTAIRSDYQRCQWWERNKKFRFGVIEKSRKGYFVVIFCENTKSWDSVCVCMCACVHVCMMPVLPVQTIPQLLKCM